MIGHIEDDLYAAVEIRVFKGGAFLESATFVLPIVDHEPQWWGNVEEGPSNWWGARVAGSDQSKKIAKAFGWQRGDRYRLTPVFEVPNAADPNTTTTMRSPFVLEVDGPEVLSSPYGAAAHPIWYWPDDDVDVRGVKQRVSLQGRKERWLVDGVLRAPFRPITIEAVPID
ncbi:hypothetical protein H2198_005178 [Neophaeococcomyces mojaviensis]|uniref:Uncharacterized protein n=1 Tax=Neophaeococcomyces mojaviensis TaxID=3383035 RepID=A0ACC3A6R5_9EURO|nr:hypothetical protein H2198_005178 [Knufia sp. JES_112]